MGFKLQGEVQTTGIHCTSNSISQTSLQIALTWGVTSIFRFFPFFRMIRIRKTGFLGTIGILGSSPIRGYPYHFCSCPECATKEQNGKTVFPDLWPNQIRKTGKMGIFGILTSSPIRGYPCHSCSCPGWATIEQNVRTGKPVLKPDRTGSGFFRPRFWVPGVMTDPMVYHMWS